MVLCLVGFVWWRVNDLSQRGCQLWGDWLLVDKVCAVVADCGLPVCQVDESCWCQVELIPVDE